VNVWGVCEGRRRIRFNNANCDKAVRTILDADDPGATVHYRLKLDPSKAAKYFAQLPDLDDAAARSAIASLCLKELAGSGWVENFKQLEAPGMTKDEAEQWGQLKDALHALQLTVGESQNLQREIEQQRNEIY